MHALPITAALVGTTLAAQGPSVRARGRHYEVVCHFASTAPARQALDVAEATWPVAMRLYGAADQAPERPLEVHLYRDAAAYAEAEAALTAGRFRRNLAFAHFATKSAHVAVQPRLPDAVLDRVGLGFQTLRLLVHEAAHLARYAAMPNHRSHPGWFADGNATWIEAEVLRSAGLMAGIEEDPTFAAKIGLVQRLAGRGALPPVSSILLDQTGELAFYETYAVRWLLFAFLMGTEPRALRATIDEMRGLGAGELAPPVAAALRRRLGGADFDALDARFRAYVGVLDPQWDELGRSLETAGAAWVQTAFDDRDAVAWRTRPIGWRAFALEGVLTVLPDGARRLDVLLGRSEAGWVGVAFGAESGVTVFAHDVEAGRDTELRRADAPRLRAGERVAFAIRSSIDGRLRVELEGRPLLSVDVGRPLDGAWGLSARAGSTGIWENVAVAGTDGPR